MEKYKIINIGLSPHHLVSALTIILIIKCGLDFDPAFRNPDLRYQDAFSWVHCLRLAQTAVQTSQDSCGRIQNHKHGWSERRKPMFWVVDCEGRKRLPPGASPPAWRPISSGVTKCEHEPADEDVAVHLFVVSRLNRP